MVRGIYTVFTHGYGIRIAPKYILIRFPWPVQIVCSFLSEVFSAVLFLKCLSLTEVPMFLGCV